MRLTIKAMAYAKEKHRGQEDDNGYDYYKVHLLPVGRAVSQFTDDEETTGDKKKKKGIDKKKGDIDIGIK